jgi:hypothetical protein
MQTDKDIIFYNLYLANHDHENEVDSEHEEPQQSQNRE